MGEGELTLNNFLFSWQNLFRNYGDVFLPKFKPHIERLIKDTSHDKHASSQRCAMEVLAGIILGSKLWPYQKVSFFIYIYIFLQHFIVFFRTPVCLFLVLMKYQQPMIL